MKKLYGFDNHSIQQIFEEWNKGELNSFLLEITAHILKKKEGDQYLVDLISDWARSKGTGKWTSQNAMDLQVPVPVIDAAVNMRDMSKYKPERLEAAKLLHWDGQAVDLPAATRIARLKDALYFVIITTYAQGFAQLTVASESYSYELDLQVVTKVWRGGCIIRAALLEDFRKAYAANPDLRNILLDRAIAQKLLNTQASLREVLKDAIANGIPVPGYLNALSYFDAYRSEKLPTNIIQAQRDYFGAHTYERIDQEGIFHTLWD